jgi:hypothetical protein
MSTSLDSSEAAILDRLFRPSASGWPGEAAHAILKIEFAPSDREKMSALLEIAKSGTLTQEQAETLEHYRHVGRLLELMKSRARQSLRNKPSN